VSRTPVAIMDLGDSGYPDLAPFDPPEAYPEAPYAPGRLDPSNKIYSGVRETLRLLGLDAARFGTPDWNPMGEYVRPGDHVVLKPNMVRHFHGDGLSTESLVSHGSVIRAVLDYVLVALKGEGKLTVGDSPLQYSDFQTILKLSGLGNVIEEAARRSGFKIETVDFRKERAEKVRGMIVSRIPNNGDPMGYKAVELGDASRFHGLDERCPRLRVTQYDPGTMTQNHNPQRHAYLFPATVLDADVLINVPKLKTHRKAGLTAAMKNLVGINGSKDWLPHHSFGSLAEGGDEYLAPSIRKRMASLIRDKLEAAGGKVTKRVLYYFTRALHRSGAIFPFPDPYFEGSWYGNDTIWRTVHDLHKVLFFSSKEGKIQPEPQRRYFALIDGVVAGEREGPMHPFPKKAGLLIGSRNPLAADLACCRIMGFDERKLPILNYGVGNGFYPSLGAAEEIELRSNLDRWTRLFELSREETLAFEPSAGWKGHIELDR
jgi:uncharacterized protein (DUF362 family)